MSEEESPWKRGQRLRWERTQAARDQARADYARAREEKHSQDEYTAELHRLRRADGDARCEMRERIRAEERRKVRADLERWEAPKIRAEIRERILQNEGPAIRAEIGREFRAQLSEKERRRRDLGRVRLKRPISTRLRTHTLERDGFRCRRCGARAPETRLVVDHVIPVAAGGVAALDNLQTLCEPCNLGKGARPPHDHDRAAAS